MPVFLDAAQDTFERDFAALLGAKREESADVDETVGAIIADVRKRGDTALIELTERFDRLTLTPQTLRFTEEEIAAHCAMVDDADRASCWNR